MKQGLKFKRVDLHIHTPASPCFKDKCEPEDIVKEAINRKLDVIAITDHNTGDWIDRVKEAAKNSGLVVIPGVEVTVENGIHTSTNT